MKKVLIITYYWPPAGGAGVQRALKFVKYLPQFGWQPIILTVENPDCPVYDKTLLNDIPTECVVYKTKALEPFELYKIFTGKSADSKIPSDVLANNKNQSLTEKISKWVRFNLFIPDAKIGWKAYAVKKANIIIEKENIELLFSTAPPPTVALIGKKIAKKNNLKWVADFRDPWMEIVHYQNIKRSFITKFIDSKLEKSVLRKADVLLTISKDIVQLFKSKVGDKKYSIIPNGFDETDFKIVDNIRNKKFTIAYTGVITPTRVPHTFLNTLSKMIHTEGISDIEFVLAGKTCSEFDKSIEQNKLSDYFNLKGFLPHKESTEILQKSDILLLVVDDVQNNKGFLTGKIFEYLGAKKPIYAIGPTDGDANEIIRETNSGQMVDYHDEERSYSLLKEMYNQWKENRIVYKFNVEQYSRKKQAEQLSKIFEELTK